MDVELWILKKNGGLVTQAVYDCETEDDVFNYTQRVVAQVLDGALLYRDGEGTSHILPIHAVDEVQIIAKD